jgi:hypothetical protein
MQGLYSMEWAEKIITYLELEWISEEAYFKISWYLPGTTDKSPNSSVKIDDAPTETRTEYLPITCHVYEYCWRIFLLVLVAVNFL